MGGGSGMEVYFYHLERQSLDDALPKLLELSLARGWRAVVQAASEERVEALNTRLWTYRQDSFLPHGTAGEGRSAEHPIYLTTGDDNPNGAQIRFLVDGAVLADTSSYVRVAYVFDGGDTEAVVRAREAWQAAKTRGDAVSYWQQEPDGSWHQKA
jgi:DNA polymerase-3 subunit chi